MTFAAWAAGAVRAKDTASAKAARTARGRVRARMSTAPVEWGERERTDHVH